jgi:hypothetical protein
MVAGQKNWLQEEQDEHGQENKWEGIFAGHYTFSSTEIKYNGFWGRAAGA